MRSDAQRRKVNHKGTEITERKRSEGKKKQRLFLFSVSFLCVLRASVVFSPPAVAAEPTKKASIDGSEPGFVALGKTDFVNVNCADDTWSFDGDTIRCTGTPTGVMRTTKHYTNLELVVEWRHLKSAGNSGVFLWATDESINGLQPNKLPHGIEVQILDHGYTDLWKQKNKKDTAVPFFSTNGDVFNTGVATMTPYEPTSPNGTRGFPRKNLSRGSPEWNHYYVRAINGEVRLWVNGEEVSGGHDCKPATGYLCLESEGSPVEFRGLRIRELP